MGLHILHVAEILAGGTASYLSEILAAQRADRRIASVRLLLPEFHRDALAIPPGCEAAYFGGGASRAWRSLALARALRATLRERPASVVHLHGSYAGFAGRLAVPAWRERIVYCSHGWAFDRAVAGWANRLVAGVERALAPLAQAIVCISRHDHALALQVGIAPARLRLVCNGVRDLSAVPPSEQPEWPALGASQEPGALRCLFVGRLDRQKGVEVFLAALADQPGLSGAVVGGSVVSGADGASGLQVPANVAMLGWRDREAVRRWIAACDVLVVPSRWEGFGLIAAEGMRAGKPVVASEVGGLRELVVDGLTGRLVPPDDPAALRRALLQLRRMDPRAMGAAGRARFLAHFEARRMNEALVQLYQEIDAAAAALQPGRPRAAPQAQPARESVQ